ncbi:MAG: M36 family metallopeptidase [Acidobacteriota bacterium]|nr:M36 family metallopeptidase [Acidobacteriota bacterium]
MSYSSGSRPGGPSPTHLLRRLRPHRLHLPWLGALALACFLTAAPAWGIADILDIHRPLADFDSRTDVLAPTPQQLALVDQLGAAATWNRFGTPQSLINYGSFLASGYGSDPATAARAWLRDNSSLFHLSAQGVDALELVNVSPMGGPETAAVLFRQSFGGLIAASGGLITVGVTDGDIVYASSSAVGDQAPPGAPVLSATEAWLLAASSIGLPLSALDLSGLRQEGDWTVFDVLGLLQPQRSRLRAFPTPIGGVLPAFETLVLDVLGGHAQAYTIFVDAQTGELLARHNRVQRLQAPTAVQAAQLLPVPRWNLFPANPPLDLSTNDTRSLACWTLTDSNGQPISGCDLELENSAARAPWDHLPLAGAPTFTTLGNAASSASAWLSPLTPAEGYRPVSLDRNYDFPWLNTWQESGCSPLSFTPPGVTNANDLDAATVNLFAMHNRMHDWSYFLGFTEANYNLQVSNFGLTPPNQETDPEIGNVQAGAVTGGFPTFLGRDNANQVTLNDGIPGITNMYLWQPIAGAFYAPCVDGDFDMGVIGHEYTHAISNRMAGGPDDNLTGAQAGAMGESWSDLVAMEYLNEYGLVPTAGESPYAVGTYATGSGEKGIRNYNMSRNLTPPAVGAHTAPLTQRNPLNYSNVGYDTSGAQVHADGEIWSTTNFDLRAALVDKYDAQFPAADAVLQARCADGELPADLCPGNRRWAQIVFDAWLLMPASVSMLDARDAYLAADMMRFGGANQLELWRTFAHRGMGENASSQGADDSDPAPSFESPLEAEANLLFNIVDTDTGAPVEAEVFIGHYEARSVPVADTVAGTVLGATVSLLPGLTQDFLVRADGYGHVRFPYQALSASSSTLTVGMPKNLASTHNGATAAGSGVNLDALIDDTEATNWADLIAPAAGDQVTVDLSGGVQRITRVNVSALLRPEDAENADSAAQNRFTALRQFEIRTCVTGASLLNPTCSGLLPTGFSTIFTSPADAFPAGVPRPLAPDMILREFDVPDTDATHVQLRVLHSQCTGTPAYQGEQDADPLNATDCSTASSNADVVRAAELQVFGTDPSTPD